MEHYEKNIRNYMLYRFFWSMLIIGPVLTPYLRWKALSYTEIMWLQSIAALSVVCFEVPTGAIADKISRKLSLALSGLCLGIALIIYIQTSDFYVFAIGEVLFGLGITFGSGADSALLYESLERMGRKHDYAHIEGRTASFVFAGQGIGSIASSLLYAYNPDIPFWISVGSAFTAAAFACRFVETEREKNDHQYHTHVIKSLNIAFKSQHILWIICLAALLGFASRSGFWLYEPYFTWVNIEVAWFGLIFFGFNMIASLSAKYLTNRVTNQRMALLGMGLLLAASYILPALLIAPWAISLIGLQQIVRGTYRPTLNNYINQHSEDKYRATVISIVSVSASLVFASLSPFVGNGVDTYGAVTIYWIMGIVTLIGLLFLSLMHRKQALPSQIQAA